MSKSVQVIVSTDAGKVEWYYINGQNIFKGIPHSLRLPRHRIPMREGEARW